MSPRPAAAVWCYTASDNSTTLPIFEHVGTALGARRKAIALARKALPASEYRGYGPRISVWRKAEVAP